MKKIICVSLLLSFSVCCICDNAIEDKYKEGLLCIDNKEYHKAMTIMWSLSDLEYAPAQFQVWRLIYNGWFANQTDEDNAIAYQFLFKSAENGYIEALNWLGLEYMRMDSFAVSVSYYERALEQGDEDALFWLTKMYYEGRPGLPQDREKAFALAQGYSEMSSAKCFLSQVYKEGLVVPIDTIKANYYYHLCNESMPLPPPPPLIIE